MNMAYKKQIEEKLLQKALNIFHQQTGLNFKIERTHFLTEEGIEADTLLELDLPGIDGQFVVEIKARLTDANMLLAVMDRLGGAFPAMQGMIITEYVNPLMAERLKKHGIAFLDLAGNAYVNAPPVLIFIKGNKPAEPLPRQTRNRAFQATGLKMLFALINNPELVNAPYREIAKTANVALGTVGWVFTDLKDGGFLVEMGKRGKRLKNKKQLIERWVTAFPEVLKPKVTRGLYTAKDPYWWKDAQIKDFDAFWGGEVAAARITKYLKPEMITVYICGEPGEFLMKNKLKKDPQGEVELIDAFWATDIIQHAGEMVPPLLIYADLIATGDTRNLETAKLIYEQEIAGLIGED